MSLPPSVVACFPLGDEACPLAPFMVGGNGESLPLWLSVDSLGFDAELLLECDATLASSSTDIPSYLAG